MFKLQQGLLKPFNKTIRFQYSTIRTVLGIETSCDDTAVGVVTTDRTILAESKYNQWSIHKTLGSASKKYNSQTAFGGGVIPNVARLLHRENLIYAVSDCIKQVDKGWDSIDAISLTVKPGLEPCLWEGIQFTKLLLQKYKLPFIPIHHMEAHALMPRLLDRDIRFPFLTLLISGGHCILALVENDRKFLRLGESIDISPGNFIDKTARKLGLFHLNDECTSGGALMELYAKNGNPDSFPRMIKSVENHCKKMKNCDFSYAATNRLIDKLIESDYTSIQVLGEEKKILKIPILMDVCASVQKMILIQLEDRLQRALTFLNIRNIKINDVVVSGGVASNLYIKSSLEKVCGANDVRMSIPPVAYCTDNGVMIAWNACEKLLSKSDEIVQTNQQDRIFFDKLEPLGKCDLGSNIEYQIKMLNIKN